MDTASGASSFRTSRAAYDLFMGRYSRPLADLFADSVGLTATGITAAGAAFGGAIRSVLDVGCGPGALTGVLVDRLGAGAVSACDPSEPFVAECAAAHPGVDVVLGRAEAIPFDDDRFDVALAQLVLHFVTDPQAAAAELARVVRPGGVVAACVWDFERGMEMLSHYWDAALDIDPTAPTEARTRPFGRQGAIFEWLLANGFHDVEGATLEVTSTYSGFDELWSGFLNGIGPAGTHCVSLDAERQAALRDSLFRRLGSPGGSFTLGATAHSAHGRVPPPPE